MCLKIKTNADPARTGTITCWKRLKRNLVVQISNSYCFSERWRLESVIFPKVWRQGVNKSTRKTKKLTREETRQNIVDKGIHVYLKRPSEKTCGFYNVIVPIQCNMRDLVRIGLNNEAVFMKARITSQDYKKALKKD